MGYFIVQIATVYKHLGLDLRKNDVFLPGSLRMDIVLDPTYKNAESI